MNPVTLIDAGPLVALLSEADKHHRWAKSIFDSLISPVFTCEAVIAEACYMLRRPLNSALAVLGLIERGVVRIDFRIETEAARVRELMTRYASRPMSFADGCLVRMTELSPEVRVMTTTSSPP